MCVTPKHFVENVLTYFFFHLYVFVVYYEGQTLQVPGINLIE